MTTAFEYDLLDVEQITSAQYNTARKTTVLEKGKTSNWVQSDCFLFREHEQLFLFIKNDGKWYQGKIMRPYFDPSKFTGVHVQTTRTILRLYINHLPEFEDDRATA